MTDSMSSNKTIIKALSLSDLPVIEDFYDTSFPGQFNHILLSKMQILASDIEELCDLIQIYGMPDYPVILCRMNNLYGCVYLEGDIDWPLVFIDSLTANTYKNIRKTYIHEAAHLISDGQDHDFVFSVTYNTYLLRSGYEFTEEEYDYRNCRLDDLSFNEVKELSTQLARIVFDSKIAKHLEIDSIRYLEILLRKYQGRDDRSRLLVEFSRIVDRFGSLSFKNEQI